MSNYVENSIAFLKDFDPEISEAINLELKRQRNNIRQFA